MAALPRWMHALISRTPDRGERMRGALIGAACMTLTLFFGGALSAVAQWSLGLLPYGGLVWSTLLFWVPGFAYGAWLVVPAAIAGAWRGDAVAFEWSIIPWGTSDQFGRKATALSWMVLIAICLISEWLAGTL
ncbi:MAG: hypothetical protein JNJ55_04695 [Betaproteobacteria bacterium]|nr:hypothetical protein [Betaproteobacteria bacterium]